MADISRLSRLLNGVQRQVELSTNTLVVDNLKIKMGSGNDSFHATFSGSLSAARTITMPDANVNLGDIATNKSNIDGHLDGGASKHDATEIDYERVDGSKKNIAAASDDVELALTNLDDAIGTLVQGTNYTAASAGIVASHLAGIDSALAASVDHGSLTGLGDDDHTQYTLANGTRAFTGAQSMGGFKLTSLAAGTANGDAVRYEQLTAVEAMVNGLEFQDSALDYITDNTVAPLTTTPGDRYVLSATGGSPHIDYGVSALAGDIVEYDGSNWIPTTPTTGMFISIDDEPSVLYYWGGSAWSTKSFEATTASTGLTKVGVDVRLADAAENASGIQVSGGVITLNDLGAFDTDDLAEGATNKYFSDEAAQDAVGTILADSATVDFTYTDGTPEITAIVKTNSISESHLTASVAGDGLTGGNGTALAVGAGTGISVAANAVSVDYAPSVQATGEIAGEAFSAATLYAVRYGQNAETAGRIYKADNDASSTDNFHVVGLALTVGALSAADTVPNIFKMGPITATAHGFTVGKPVWLGASGALTSTAPTTASLAVVKVGMVKDANTIDVQVQVMGVN